MVVVEVEHAWVVVEGWGDVGIGCALVILLELVVVLLVLEVVVVVVVEVEHAWAVMEGCRGGWVVG